MAENKKSFVLYADMLKSIEHLTNEEKGILFNHLLEYVNDKNPILEDRLILTAWKPIELQLKRDLRKFEEVKAKRSDAGKRSAELKAQKKEEQNSTNSTSVDFVQQTSTNSTDNDTVNDNDNDNENDNVNVSTDVDELKNDDDFLNFKILHFKNYSDDFDFVFEIQKTKNLLDEETDQNKKIYLSQVLNFLISEKRKKVAPKKENNHQQYIDELKKSTSWLEVTSMNNKASPEIIIEKLDEFEKFLKSITKLHPSQSEFLKHFVNWLPSKLIAKPTDKSTLVVKNR